MALSAEDDVARLEAERLRPMPPDPVPDPLRELIALIAAECRRKGYLPGHYRHPRSST